MAGTLGLFLLAILHYRHVVVGDALRLLTVLLLPPVSGLQTRIDLGEERSEDVVHVGHLVSRQLGFLTEHFE